MDVVIGIFVSSIEYLLNHIVFVNVLFTVVIVFFQRREPRSVWAWLLVLYAIPLLGFIIYLFAGTDMHKRKMFRLKEIEDQINEAIRRQEHQIASQQMIEENPELEEFSDLVYYNLRSSSSILSKDNEIQIFTEGSDKFEALISDIEQAQKFIHLQYYIIRKDLLFDRIKEALIKKAAQGVEVRILFDGMGCRGVPKSYWKELEKGGIHTAIFFPAALRQLHLRMNYRNHRKIAVIDNQIAYVGGFNIGKEYIGLDKKFGHWRDTHLRIMGTGVTELQIRFILDWNYATRENLFQKNKYLERVQNTNGHIKMQIISSGPDSALQNIRNNYVRLINKARKSIYIQTPYFIPDETIFNALMIAIYSGVEVQIMIPCKPDHPFVYWATYSYVGDMVMAGARCYTYDDGFLHTKGLIVDEKVYCYGTANMDIRSYYLNFEVNAVVYDEEEARRMKEIFEQDLKSCSRITREKYSRRNLIVRVKEQFCRLLSPLL